VQYILSIAKWGREYKTERDETYNEGGDKCFLATNTEIIYIYIFEWM
jgi:hypothetical protein